MAARPARLRMVVALVLLVAGVAGLVAGSGALGRRVARSVLLADTVVDWFTGPNRALSLAAVVTLALLALVVGVRLLVTGLRRSAGHDLVELRLPPARPWDALSGRTVVRAPALARTLERDLARIAGVQRALVGLHGRPDEPELRTQVDMLDTADVAAVRAGVAESLDRLATTMGMSPRGTEVTLRVVGTDRAARRRL
jgi:hypothetical protein